MVDEVSVPRFTEVDSFPETIAMYQNGWPPTGGPINIAADQGLLNWPLRDLTNRTRNLKNRLDDMALKAGTLVTVGPGGDYATINAALSELSERRPGYLLGGFTTEVLLLDGFTMAEQVLVGGVDLGWISIVSEAAEVLIDRSYLVTLFNNLYPAFGARDSGVLPRIDCLFTMMANADGTDRAGISLTNGALANVGVGGGIRNAGGAGASVLSGSVISANYSIFSNSGIDGAILGGGCRASFQGADMSGADRYCIFASNASICHAVDAICSGGGNAGVRASFGGSVSARNVNARIGGADSTSDFIVEGGSTISANGGIGGTSQAANTVTANGIIFK